MEGGSRIFEQSAGTRSGDKPDSVARLEACLSREPAAMALAVHEGGMVWGIASPAAARLSLDAASPMRSASNTKTFVAATILRMWEEGELGLDDPLGTLASPAIADILRRGGYDLDRITVRHLLNHSAGLYDHADDSFLDLVLEAPGRRWTREEQVRLCMTRGGPESPPGTRFRYSDTGYILLGDIIETRLGRSLASAVRERIGFDRLGLSATWWEAIEPAPPGISLQGRQFFRKRDVFHFDPTMDLYGGGGLVMSAADLARAMAAIFEGRVFRQEATLAEMLKPAPHEGEADYRLGIFVSGQGESRFFWHIGFWGSAAYYRPARGLSVAGYASRREDRSRLMQIIETEMMR
ncbi:beta-lactamase family protein [Rhizobium cremeum]|uniref:serine hydrolase domain-containing protein n=1 Tax=Rhizobium cremeum TaxID=2813827 RepID=UPI001FD26C93|nr:serine hydrolase domain-containing protein [Rhizobium cremeum]MCJ7996941.1 beta-lactamase family protein [Rhizobium cremeum]MCJ8002159.1 beta-lactamase family protein [Rhizobium cremeum]